MRHKYRAILTFADGAHTVIQGTVSKDKYHQFALFITQQPILAPCGYPQSVLTVTYNGADTAALKQFDQVVRLHFRLKILACIGHSLCKRKAL